MLRHLATICVLAAALSGCGHDSSGDEPATTPMPPSLPGAYAGDFPCSNCKAIATGLWLRSDGRYFLRQRFVAEDGTTDNGTFALGRWTWDERAAELVLRGVGPERRLTVLDEQRLKLRNPSPVEEVLSRDSAAPAFVERVRFDGESSIVDGNATFKECVTGLTVAVAQEGGYKELRRQHRAVNRSGEPAFTSVEAHLAQSPARESLVVDRVIALKPRTHC